MKLTALSVSFVVVLTVMSGRYIFVNSAPEDSTMGVSHNLACPCECPMVLEDCHMSCGLRWKDQIGAKLKVGLKQENINSYFYKRYGKEAMLTTVFVDKDGVIRSVFVGRIDRFDQLTEGLESILSPTV